MSDPFHTGWHAALDAQADQLRLWSSERGTRLAYLHDQALTDGGASEDNATARIAGTITFQRETLEAAEPIWVSDDVYRVIREAHKSFKREPFLATDLTIPAGFLLLPAPLPCINDEGREVNFRACSWRAYEDGAWLSFYGCAGDDPTLNPEQVAALGALAASELMFVAGTYLHYGREPSSTGNVWEAVQAIWRLMRQLVRVEHTPPRAVRRRAEKAGASKVGRITVVQLRREKREPDEGHVPSPAHYSHRFAVRGHWRNQWYPSIQAHRQKWIAPYIKGGEDKPLVLKGRAYEFTR